MTEDWWQSAVVYQIYPRSFKDSNGDGLGDLPGITIKLDYLAELGITAIWLCPVFRSPMADNGYDISDYRGISPGFGSLNDMETLIAEADKRGIKIFLDLVLNHTSDQHPWFKSAVSDPKSPYRDYYIFRKGADGKPPTNWRSIFGGPVWESVPSGSAGAMDGGGEYYLHIFAKEQPDLNWENPKLRQELYDMIHWWMDKGVAGFRIDAISYIKKDPAYPNLPVDGPDGLADLVPCCLVFPGIEKFLAELRDKVFKPRNAFTVAEAYGVRPEQLRDYAGEGGLFSAIFDFTYTDLENGIWYKTWLPSAAELRDLIFRSQKGLLGKGRGAPYFENHDQNRSPNRYLHPEQWTREGKTMLGILFFFLQGIPFIYQGQELGMTNYPWKSLDEFNDVSTFDQYQRALAAGFSKDDAFRFIQHRSRDNARTPMLWDNSPNAGFSSGKPWLPVHPDYVSINAEAERQDANSVFAFYRSMIALRKKHPDLFFAGDFIPHCEDNPSLIVYERSYQKEGRHERALVICNFSDEKQRLDISNIGGKGAKGIDRGALVLLGNRRNAGASIGRESSGNILLEPLEGLVLGL